MIKKNVFFFLVSFLVSMGFAQEQKFRINYIGADNVYIEAGTINGLQVGDRLTVRQKGRIIAELEVVYTARGSSSCRVISKERMLQIGDFAFTDTISEADSSEIVLSTRRQRNFRKQTESPGKNLQSQINGSLSLQWYRFNDLSSSGFDFSQPALRFAVRARRLWGGAYNLRIRFRSKYNQRTRRYNLKVPAGEWRNRMYEFSLSYVPEGAVFQYRLGRIISAHFSGVGYIDGVSAQYKTSDFFRLGVFAGNQPEWENSSFQTSIQKFGVYAAFTRGTYERQRFESTFSIVGAYHGATISREFLYWQNVYNLGKTLALYQSLEVDYNQSWRKIRMGESFSLTGLYFSGRYRPFKWLSAGLTYDNRKNYFTYEMRSLADSLFDSAFRQGIRSNVAVTLPGNYRISTNFGLRQRQYEKVLVYSYGFAVRKYHFLRRNISVLARFSGFSNTFTEGYNPSLRMGKALSGGHAFYLTYGNYWYRLNSLNVTRINQWLRFNSQLELPARMFLSAQFEYDWGDDMLGQRYFVELGYRF